jgi:hypothetical protein
MKASTVLVLIVLVCTAVVLAGCTSSQTATLGSDAGDTVILAGTRGTGSYAGEFDRVQVYVTMKNGITYKVADVLRQYRSRSGSGE